MAKAKDQPTDDVWSAPESGTVCGPTSGNNPSDRGLNLGQGYGADSTKGSSEGRQDKDDPSVAGEER